jgi:serine/threonine protein kinase
VASNAPPILPPNSRLAGYEIAGLVGRGGMGEVYRAKQLSMQREVALKVLSPRLARSDPAFADQFVAEARAAGKLNHPNIVAVHDVGQAPAPPGCHDVVAEQPIHYFSMEFIEGETVKDLIERQGAVDITTVGKVMAAMAEALSFAETHKIVHRDIKPDNIMLTAGGGVKLADLGLALQADSAEAVAGSKDDQGRGKVMGTPLYMAPEQARAQPIDHRADQYALGATLFHMLTGRTPFQGESSKAIMRAHCFEPLPDPCEVNPQVPPPWRDMCMRMLAKLPDDRFAGAVELRAACKAAIRWRPGPAPRVRNTRSQQPWLAIVVVSALLLALGWWWLTKAAPQPPARIDDPSPQPTAPATSVHPVPEPAHQARVQVERTLTGLANDPVAALAAAERMLADPTLSSANDLIISRRDALRTTVEERRRAPLIAALDAAFQQATSGRLQAARDGLAKVPEEAWNKVRRAEISARIELSERTIETRLAGEIDQAADARACDTLGETLVKAELSPTRTKSLQDRLEQRRRDVAVKAPPKMLKVDTGPIWKALGEQIEAARASLPYSNLAEAARSAARNLADQERQHAELLAEVAESAQQAETALRLYIGQATPKAECRFGSRTGTFILTRLEKDSVGVRLVDAPAETKVDRSSAVLPWAQLLTGALTGVESEHCKAAFLWYWRLPEARAALDGLKDDQMAVAIAAYERRTRAIDIPGDQERRKDGVVAITYPFQASRNAGLLGAWKGNGATLTETGLHWESSSLVPRGSNAEADLSTLGWRSVLHPPIELTARVVPDADSEVVMVGLISPELGIRLAFNTKLRRAFILATSKDDRAAYQAHGAKGAPEYKPDGADLHISVDATGKVALWIDDKPVPLDYELAFPANARITPVIQGRPVQAKSGISVLSLSLSGKP